MPVRNEERHLAEAVGARAGPGLPGRARGGARGRPLPRPHRGDRAASWRRPTPGSPWWPTPAGASPRATQRGDQGLPATRSSPGWTGTRCSRPATCGRGRDAAGDRRGQRRRDHGRRGRHPVRAGRGLGDDLAGRGRQRPVPHRRRRRAGRHASTWASSAAAALERVGGYDEDYLRAEDWEMNHRIRQAGGLVWFQPGLQVTYRPRANAGRARHAVLPLRPLAPGGRAPARGHDQPALPGAARRGAGDAGRRADRRRGLVGLAAASGRSWPGLAMVGFAVPAVYLAGILG